MRWQDAEREIRALPNPYERFKAIRAKSGDPATTGGPPAAGGAPSAEAGAPNLGGNWPQGGQVSRPRTDDEFNALPAGALYVDPDDGQTYRK